MDQRLRRSSREPKPIEAIADKKENTLRITCKSGNVRGRAKNKVQRCPTKEAKQKLNKIQLLLPAVKPYKCKSCSRRFYFAEDCNFHEALHSEDFINLDQFQINNINLNQLHPEKSQIRPGFTADQGQCQDLMPTISLLEDSKHSYEIKSTILSLTSISVSQLTAENPETSKFKCSFCDRGYASRASKEEHEKVHRGELPYQCQVCDNMFPSLRRYNFHTKATLCSISQLTTANSETSKFKCSFCDREYASQASKEEHEKIHRGELPYQCQVCDNRFPSLRRYNFHTKATLCSKVIAADKLQNRGNFDLVNHNASGTSLKLNPMQTSYVNDVQTYSGQSQHAMAIDDNDYNNIIKSTTFLKPKSNGKIDTNADLQLNFCCNICGKQLTTYSAAAQHSQIHKGFNIKPLQFQCIYCRQKFSRKGAWEVHETMHTGEKKFPCPECQLAFRWKSSLQKHLKNIHVRPVGNSI